MSLSVLNVIAYAQSQSSLTALVPANSVWLDVAGDGNALPYVIVNQVSQTPAWQTGPTFVSSLRLRLIVYASTLASMNAIVTAIQAAFDWQNITSAGFGARLENIIPRGTVGGAYSAVVEYTVRENLAY